MSRELAELPSTFTARRARLAGVGPSTLAAWRDKHLVYELSRGVYRRSDAPQPTHPDLLAVSQRAPHAAICGKSAAAIWDLTDDIPFMVEVAVEAGRTRPTISYPPTVVHQFSPATFDLGLTEIEVAPEEKVRIYDATRTVVDFWRLRHTWGEVTAQVALSRYLKRRGARPGDLYTMARALGVGSSMLPAIDLMGAQ